MIPADRSAITGAVLAGGASSRMGEDKAWAPVAGKPLIAWVIEAVRGQAGSLLINANHRLDAYRRLGYPVLADEIPGRAGPLAGIARCMAAARSPYLLCVPCDTPFLPGDLAARLLRRLRQESADICMARTGPRTQPVCVLFREGLRDSLLAFLAGGGRKPETWYGTHRTVTEDFGDAVEAFLNVNTPEQAAAAAARLESAAPTARPSP